MCFKYASYLKTSCLSLLWTTGITNQDSILCIKWLNKTIQTGTSQYSKNFCSVNVTCLNNPFLWPFQLFDKTSLAFCIRPINFKPTIIFCRPPTNQSSCCLRIRWWSTYFNILFHRCNWRWTKLFRKLNFLFFTLVWRNNVTSQLFICLRHKTPILWPLLCCRPFHVYMTFPYFVISNIIATSNLTTNFLSHVCYNNLQE